jgi:hypothetical protein
VISAGKNPADIRVALNQKETACETGTLLN